MATITPAQPTLLAALPAESPATTALPVNPELVSKQYRWSVRQYDKMTEVGVLTEHDRLELIEGLVVIKLGRNRPHVVAGKKGLRVLSRILPPGWHVAKGDPIVASDWSKPEPDLAIVKGDAEDYLDHDVTAKDFALVIEIAESSLSIDQKVMARIYASSGIPVYWIVNLVDHQIEVHTSPGSDGYLSSEIMKPGQEVAVLIDGAEIGRIPVSDILP
jgi:Uma2 family endonuclease